MKPLISVVVPVYKVESYLEKCIVSIINQTYTNLDIILVDDGSPDDCGSICDSWAKKDSRIRVVHKSNGGLSDARNYGIKSAKGMFITFIDSDDYIDKTYVSYLYELIEKYSAQVSVCSFYQVYEDSCKKLGVGGEQEKLFGSEDAIESMLYDKDFYTCAWGKMYLTSLFENISYPKGKLYEDLATTYKLISLATKIAYGPEKLYLYLQRNGSILRSSFKSQNFDLIEVVDVLFKDLIKIYPDIHAAALYRKQCSYLAILSMLIETKSDFKYQENIKDIVAEVRNTAKVFVKDKHVTLLDKILCMSSYGGFGFYKFIYYLEKVVRKLYSNSKNYTR